MNTNDIKIIITESNCERRKEITDYINLQKDMEVILSGNNGVEVINTIIEKKPQIAVIDMLMAGKDGLCVLEELLERNITETECIIVSSFDDENLVRRAMNLGAKYYMLKPYKAEIMARRIRQLCERQCKEHNSEAFENKKIENIDGKNSLEFVITSVLNKIGISAGIKGYYFLRSSITMAVIEDDAMIGITKKMYPDIAKSYKTSACKVERAIRHAIESAWKRGAKERYNEIVGSTLDRKPTNGQFIGSLAEYIKLLYNNSISA